MGNVRDPPVPRPLGSGGPHGQVPKEGLQACGGHTNRGRRTFSRFARRQGGSWEMRPEAQGPGGSGGGESPGRLTEEQSPSASCLSFPICEMGRCSSCPFSLPSGSREEAEIKPTAPGAPGRGDRINRRIIKGVLCTAREAGCKEASSLPGRDNRRESDNASWGGRASGQRVCRETGGEKAAAHTEGAGSRRGAAPDASMGPLSSQSGPPREWPAGRVKAREKRRQGDKWQTGHL